MEDSRPIIYYIDDEPFNLTVFETMVPEEWNTKTFANPLKALEELMEDKPWVVLSDQKMPGTSGVKFLEMVKNLTPNAIRIIVTGFSDENLVVDSVRKACIYDYIKKPWNEDDFLASYETEMFLNNKNVKNVFIDVEKMYEMGPMKK